MRERSQSVADSPGGHARGEQGEQHGETAMRDGEQRGGLRKPAEQHRRDRHEEHAEQQREHVRPART